MQTRISKLNAVCTRDYGVQRTTAATVYQTTGNNALPDRNIMLTADDNFGVKYFLRRIIFRHRYGARDRPKPWLWSQLEGDIHQAGASLHSAEA